MDGVWRPTDLVRVGFKRGSTRARVAKYFVFVWHGSAHQVPPSCVQVPFLLLISDAKTRRSEPLTGPTEPPSSPHRLFKHPPHQQQPARHPPPHGSAPQLRQSAVPAADLRFGGVLGPFPGTWTWNKQAVDRKYRLAARFALREWQALMALRASLRTHTSGGVFE
jgi:hypothetical protein